MYKQHAVHKGSLHRRHPTPGYSALSSLSPEQAPLLQATSSVRRPKAEVATPSRGYSLITRRASESRHWRAALWVQVTAHRLAVPSPLRGETPRLGRGRLRPANSSHGTWDGQLPGTARAEPPTAASRYLLHLRRFTTRAIEISVLLRYFWVALCSSLVLQTLGSCGCWWFLITETWNPPGQVQY